MAASWTAHYPRPGGPAVGNAARGSRCLRDVVTTATPTTLLRIVILALHFHAQRRPPDASYAAGTRCRYSLSRNAGPSTGPRPSTLGAHSLKMTAGSYGGGSGDDLPDPATQQQ